MITLCIKLNFFGRQSLSIYLVTIFILRFITALFILRLSTTLISATFARIPCMFACFLAVLHVLHFFRKNTKMFRKDPNPLKIIFIKPPLHLPKNYLRDLLLQIFWALQDVTTSRLFHISNGNQCLLRKHIGTIYISLFNLNLFRELNTREKKFENVWEKSPITWIVIRFLKSFCIAVSSNITELPTLSAIRGRRGSREWINS